MEIPKYDIAVVSDAAAADDDEDDNGKSNNSFVQNCTWALNRNQLILI